MEELVAEISAAFVCADLGIEHEPRDNTAAYVENWLKVLKQDTRAFITAAQRLRQSLTICDSSPLLQGRALA